MGREKDERAVVVVCVSQDYRAENDKSDAKQGGFSLIRMHPYKKTVSFDTRIRIVY